MSFPDAVVVPALLLLQDASPFQLIEDFLNSPILRLSLQLLGLLVLILYIALVYWTYSDASRRGSLKILWGIIAALFPFFGTLVWLIVRPPEYELDHRERELELAVLERELREHVQLCPNCRSIIEKDFLLCPECGEELKKPCVNCRRPLNLKWGTCPYCQASQKTGKRVAERTDPEQTNPRGK